MADVCRGAGASGGAKARACGVVGACGRTGACCRLKIMIEGPLVLVLPAQGVEAAQLNLLMPGPIAPAVEMFVEGHHSGVSWCQWWFGFPGLIRRAL